MKLLYYLSDAWSFGKLTLLLFFFVTFFVKAQSANQFESEVLAIQKKYDTLWSPSQETIVFTGSSSIRIWQDLQDRFPKYQIVNSGFGGSQASDLLHYTDDLILRYHPKKVFIYEGDNDISAGKKTKEIISDIVNIIDRVREQNPAVKVVLISAKPSIVRWQLKRQYKKLNRKFKRMSRKDADLLYADVWKPMLQKGKLKQDLFIEDGLHMNAKGYKIWYGVIQSFID